jgi:surfeit locus 1 family protein
LNPPHNAPRSASSTGMVIAFIGFAILFAGFTALGVWQVQRLFWKLDLIEQVGTRVGAAPIAAPSPSVPVTAADDQYRHLRVSGTYDHSRETLSKAVTELGAGYWVLAPLKTDQGFSVLINRGFVTPEMADPATRPEGQVEGPQVVEGLLRISEPKGGFMRTNDPAGDKWFSRDVPAIAQAKGIDGPVASYFIDAGASDLVWPRGGMTVVRFTNHHLVYALTWFGLAGMSVFGYWLVRHERRRRETSDLNR